MPPVLPDTPIQTASAEEKVGKKKKKDRKSVVSVQPIAPTGPPPDKYEMENFFKQVK